MSVMTTGSSEAPHRPLTVADLADMPDDGRRYELVNGRLDVSPAPIADHTMIESRLMVHLGNLAPDELIVLTGPGINLDATLTRHRVPDIAVMRVADFGRPYQTRPPVLAIEVVSPDSVFRDHNTKSREYAEFGITSYWIINPAREKPGILEQRLENGAYREVQQVFGEDVFETEAPFAIRLVPRWLLDDGPWRSRIGGDPQNSRV